MSRLELQQLSKRFGKVTAVDDLSLAVEAGEFVVLVGPSGCGKTTTLRMIAGLERADSGQVVIGDRQVDRLPPNERNVAMVFQDDALQPHLTIERNLEFGLRARGASREQIRQKVASAASRAGIEGLLKRRPQELSGGERQRAAVARALARSADVLLFDEPLSNLDAPTRYELRNELKRWREDMPGAVVYVTHDQAEALALADRVAVMRAGRIIQQGSPREIYEQPNSQFVAEFIGSPSMNILPGKLRQQSSRSEFHVGDQLLVLSGQSSAGEPIGKTVQNEEVHLGIRPEHIQLTEPQTPQATEGTVTLVQYNGHETLIECQLEACCFVVRTPDARGIQPGLRVGLRLPLERCYFFDIQSGAALR